MRERLSNAVVVEADVTEASFSLGRTAEILDEESGAVHTWTLVGRAEADLARGMISAESLVGAALIGRAPGDEVEVETPRGSRKYRVQQLVG